MADTSVLLTFWQHVSQQVTFSKIPKFNWLCSKNHNFMHMLQTMSEKSFEKPPKMFAVIFIKPQKGLQSKSKPLLQHTLKNKANPSSFCFRIDFVYDWGYLRKYIVNVLKHGALCCAKLACTLNVFHNFLILKFYVVKKLTYLLQRIS